MYLSTNKTRCIFRKQIVIFSRQKNARSQTDWDLHCDLTQTLDMDI